MPVDLHAHSTASDGTVSPTKLVDLAVQRGLSALALTDHDTQQGIAEAREASDGTPVDLIAGTELSLDYEKGGMHLVVLWLEPGPGPLQDRLQGLQSGRNDRNQKIVEILSDNGMPMTIDEVAEEAGAGTVGRPHIAAVMKRKGYVTEINQAFDEWLGSGKIAYVERRRLGPEEGIGLARESGAVPVLAHPHTLGISTAAEMADILTRLRRSVGSPEKTPVKAKIPTTTTPKMRAVTRRRPSSDRASAFFSAARLALRCSFCL